jgi:hypothetical protein
VKLLAEVRVDGSLFGFGTCETPVKFYFKNHATPFAVISARNISIPLLGPVKDSISNMPNEGIIEKVETPTEWTSPMVPVVHSCNGKDSKVRICVDFRKLNRSLKREQFQIPTFEELSYSYQERNIFLN